MSGNKRVRKKLSPKQLALIRSLCEGLPVEQAARVVRSSPATAWRWLADPEFKRVLEQTKAELFGQAINELKAAALTAARGLVKLLTSKNETTRRLTAIEVLEINFRAREAEDIEVRLTKLEKIVRDLGIHGVLSQDQVS